MKKLLITLIIVSAFTMAPARKANAEMIIKAVPENELEELAHLIMAEGGASNLNDEVRYGIGSVVLNRVESEKYPNTIHDVIHQRGQYSTKGYYMNLEPTEACYSVAYDLLANGTNYPKNVIYQSMFKQGSGTYKLVDGEYFCYE